MKPAISSLLTLLISAFFLVEGIWGFFSPVVFGILSTNRIHAGIHLVLGIAGLVARRKGAVKAFCGFLGCLLLLVAVLWALPSTRDAVVGLLNLNRAVAILNVVLGLGSLAIAITVPSPRRFGTPTPFQKK